MIEVHKMSIFLSKEDVAELTGIKIGRDGKSREELQQKQLTNMHVPYRVNARGEPVVTKSAVEGFEKTGKVKKEYVPAALRKAA